MDNSIHITRIYAEKWKDFKQIRLESFATDPLAFSPQQVKEAANYSEETWKEYMTKREAVVLTAKEGNNIVGLIGSYKESDEIAVIWGTYVNPSYRGKSIGKKLLQKVINTIKTDKNTKKIKLWVDENQRAAFFLYKKFGFEIVGNGNVHLIMERQSSSAHSK
jgi:ribosomal protein S18 acetylase RimI-like enzyme